MTARPASFTDLSFPTTTLSRPLRSPSRSTILTTLKSFLPFRLTVATFSRPMKTFTVPAFRAVTATRAMLLARRTFRVRASPRSLDTTKSLP